MNMYPTQFTNTNPLYQLLESEMMGQTNNLLNGNRASWDQINQVRSWFPEAAQRICQDIISTYGKQAPRNIIPGIINDFINQAFNSMGSVGMGQQQSYYMQGNQYNQRVVIPNSGYGNQIIQPNNSQGMQPMGNRVTANYTGNTSSIYNNGPSTAQPKPVEVPQPKMPIAEEDQGDEQWAPFKLTSKSNSGASVTDPCCIGDKQLCTNAITYTTSDGISSYFKAFNISVPEMDDSTMIKNFVAINRDLITNAPWMYNIVYPQYLIIDGDHSVIKDMFQTICLQVGTGQGDYTEKVLRELKKKSFEIVSIMDKLLTSEINTLIKRYLVTTKCKSVPSIGNLSDITDLFNIDSVKTYKALGSLENYTPTVISILAKVFNRYFGAATKVLSVPDDIADIIACPDFIIRTPEFTERDAVKSMEIPVLDKFHAALRERTVVTIPKRIIYSNIISGQFLSRLNANPLKIHKIQNPENILDAMLLDRLTEDSAPFDCYLYNKKAGTHTLIHVGRSLEGHLTISL